jgi:hypothetical protein
MDGINGWKELDKENLYKFLTMIGRYVSSYITFSNEG